MNTKIPTLLLFCLLLIPFGAQAEDKAPHKPTPQHTQGLQIAHSLLEMVLTPQKHTLQATATLRLQGKGRKVAPRKIRLYLNQMISLKHVEVWQGKRWQKVPFQRQLATATLQLATQISLPMRLRLRYSITFYSRKNYLFRMLFCQIEPADSYFLYGWYPSLRPFADALRGHLISKERFLYTLQMDIPKGETGISAGPLQRKIPLKDGRVRYIYGASSVKEAAIFFVAGVFRKVVWRAPKTRVTFFLRPKDRKQNVKEIGALIAKGESFYRRLWGSPSTRHAAATDKKARPNKAEKSRPTDAGNPKGSKAHHPWRVVSFGGAGARGYPFTLLLSRYEGFLSLSLDAPYDPMFSRRQVILHEMAHTWWGNALTGIGDGSTWLNEGLANYASLRALGAVYGPKAEAIAIRKHIRYFLKRPGMEGLLAPGGLAHMARRIAYSKGALVFYELERTLGKATFARALRHFFRTYRGKFATSEDLRRAFEKSSKRSLRRFFRDWIHGNQLPWFNLRKSRCRGRQCSFTLHNRGPIRGFAHIRLHGSKGRHKDLWLPLAGHTQKTLRPKAPFALTRVQLDPEGLMLHGFRWKALLTAANQLRQDGKLTQAGKHYKLILRIMPKHGQALYSMGRLLQATKQHKAALTHYRKAARAQVGPTTPRWLPLWSRYRAAVVLHKLGKTKRARQALLRLKRTKQNPYNLHGRIQETLASWKAP